MTKDEFREQQEESERRIRRSVFPLGIIYSVRLATAFCGICLLIPLLLYLGAAEVRNLVLWELAACIAGFTLSFPWERASKRRFVRLALKCPSCQASLVFLHEFKTNETGTCYNCGMKVFQG